LADDQFNFGVAQTVLVVSNEDTTDISFDISWESTAWLEVDAPPTVLAPGESTSIPVSFMPREVTTYKAELSFEVNGLSRIPVTVSGEGTKLRLELSNPAHAHLNFGQLRIGQEVGDPGQILRIRFSLILVGSARVLCLPRVHAPIA
jgi:hypothetical protein